jgi:hypothetical protein
MNFKEMWSLVKKLHIPSSLNSLKSEKKESTPLSNTSVSGRGLLCLKITRILLLVLLAGADDMEHWWNDAGRRTKVVGEGQVPFCVQSLQ